MGGAVGIFSTKLALKAGMVLLSARLDGHQVATTVDPTAALTVISSYLAQTIGLAPGEFDLAVVRGNHAIGIDHTEFGLSRVKVHNLPGPARIIIGRDLLLRMAIRFDFAKNRLRVFDVSERARVGRGLTAVPLDQANFENCLIVGGLDKNGNRQSLALIGEGPPPEQSNMMRVGDVHVAAAPNIKAGPCAAASFALPWQSFAGSQVIFDLGKGRLFLAGGGADGQN